ncbi:MAG: UDP-2,3-diacylglucosamine diphosphatase [Rhodanobacter sp.]|nr:MAG: UDP-2,3-diacylglucosamine diphosphatase [Rhodanobacter sp.]
MKRVTTPGERRLRAVFISDVHLGTKHCHAAELADFLDGLRCERLYLVGDIVDLWWIARRRTRWNGAHARVIEALHALHQRGTVLIYVPGNHDRPVRRLCGLMVPGMHVRRRAIHETVDGRRLLVTHGDDYDDVTQFGGLQERLGDWIYYRILSCDRLLNLARRRLGQRHWSLSAFVKRQSGAAERYIARFVQAGLDDAARRQLDGIVCGHIHRAGLMQRDGLVYANDGDWVESLTALTEDADGVLRLLSHHGELLAEVPPRLRLTSATCEELAA